MTNNRKASDCPAADPEPAVQQRQYFEVTEDFTLRSTLDFDWVNEKDLEIPGYVGLGPGPHELGAGFPTFAAAPKIAFRKKGKVQPLDFYQFDRIWIISDRFKAILEDFDQEGFEFVRTETLYHGGTREGPPYWFCDIIRVLDCVDEAVSTLRYYPNTRRYSAIMNAVMRPDVVGSAHVLRLRYYLGHVLVDDLFRNLVHAHKARGVAFIRLDGSKRHPFADDNWRNACPAIRSSPSIHPLDRKRHRILQCLLHQCVGGTGPARP